MTPATGAATRVGRQLSRAALPPQRRLGADRVRPPRGSGERLRPGPTPVVIVSAAVTRIARHRRASYEREALIFGIRCHYLALLRERKTGGVRSSGAPRNDHGRCRRRVRRAAAAVGQHRLGKGWHWRRVRAGVPRLLEDFLTRPRQRIRRGRRPRPGRDRASTPSSISCCAASSHSAAPARSRRSIHICRPTRDGDDCGDGLPGAGWIGRAPSDGETDRAARREPSRRRLHDCRAFLREYDKVARQCAQEVAGRVRAICDDSDEAGAARIATPSVRRDRACASSAANVPGLEESSRPLSVPRDPVG